MRGNLYDRGQEKSLGSRLITSGQEEYYKIIRTGPTLSQCGLISKGHNLKIFGNLSVWISAKQRMYVNFYKQRPGLVPGVYLQ